MCVDFYHYLPIAIVSRVLEGERRRTQKHNGKTKHPPKKPLSSNENSNFFLIIFRMKINIHIVWFQNSYIYPKETKSKNEKQNFKKEKAGTVLFRLSFPFLIDM